MINKKTVTDIYFDFDSTLSTIEGIDELAKMRGVYDQIQTISQAANDGEVPFSQVFQLRLDIIKPTKKDLEKLSKMYLDHITPGAKDLIHWLQLQGIKVSIISGGYVQTILPAASLLGIPADNLYAITLGQDHSHAYTKIVKNPHLATTMGKLDTIVKLNHPSIKIMIGDGASDAAAKGAVDYFFCFAGVIKRPNVVAVSDKTVEANNLLTIKNMFTGESYARYSVH